jgi:hypothetical protein
MAKEPDTGGPRAARAAWLHYLTTPAESVERAEYTRIMPWSATPAYIVFTAEGSPLIVLGDVPWPTRGEG